MDDYAVEAVTYNGRDSVTKMKSFNMEPITVDEAVLCLDYIDHDFYVFRNKETGEVNVLYRGTTAALDSSSPPPRETTRQAGGHWLRRTRTEL